MSLSFGAAASHLYRVREAMQLGRMAKLISSTVGAVLCAHVCARYVLGCHVGMVEGWNVERGLDCSVNMICIFLAVHPRERRCTDCQRFHSPVSDAARPYG